jgi:hypothetical protein
VFVHGRRWSDSTHAPLAVFLNSYRGALAKAFGVTSDIVTVPPDVRD